MAIIILIGLAAVFFGLTVKIVPQGKEYVVERLGKYSRTLQPGLNIILPGVDKVRKVVDMRERIGDYPPQPVITQDNVTIMIDAAVYYKVFDPKLFTYGVVNPQNALETLTATTLRNICGEKTLEQIMVARDEINQRMALALDKPTDKWGLSITRCELKSISVPQDIQGALERQLRAERERRALVTESEGKKQAQILQAEGEKQALVIRAEAQKEAAIAKAQGQAEATRLMYEAQAAGIRMINEAAPSEPYVQLEGFKYLKDLANGQATKIIVPSNLQGLAGTVVSAGELLKSDPLKVTENIDLPDPDPYKDLRTQHDPKTHKY